MKKSKAKLVITNIRFGSPSPSLNMVSYQLQFPNTELYGSAKISSTIKSFDEAKEAVKAELLSTLENGVI